MQNRREICSNELQVMDEKIFDIRKIVDKKITDAKELAETLNGKERE